MWIPGSAIVIDRHVIAGISIAGSLRVPARCGFGLAGGLLIEPLFGLLFGLLSGTGLIAVYAFRLSPTDAYQPLIKPRL